MGSTNKYTKFGQLIILNIATRCHILIFRLKCKSKFDSCFLTDCLFVPLCLRWSLTQSTHSVLQQTCLYPLWEPHGTGLYAGLKHSISPPSCAYKA